MRYTLAAQIGIAIIAILQFNLRGHLYHIVGPGRVAPHANWRLENKAINLWFDDLAFPDAANLHYIAHAYAPIDTLRLTIKAAALVRIDRVAVIGNPRSAIGTAPLLVYCVGKFPVPRAVRSVNEPKPIFCGYH
jgi:hypothetical protein